MNIQLILINNT